MSETRTRSVVKAVTWRVLASLTTVVIVLVFTGQLELALAVGGVEVVAKLIVFYFHERAWQSVGWGVRLPARLPEPRLDAKGEAQAE